MLSEILPNVGSMGLTPLRLVIGGYFKKNVPSPQIYRNLNELTIHTRNICESGDQLYTALNYYNLYLCRTTSVDDTASR